MAETPLPEAASPSTSAEPMSQTPTFTIGEAIDNNAIDAELNNGALVVHLPKSQAAKPKRIAVKAV